MIPVFKEKTDLMLHRLQYIIDDGVECELVNHIKFSLVETSLGMINTCAIAFPSSRIPAAIINKSSS